MLQAVDLECSRGSRTLFSGLAFELQAGDFLHVAGANGSGKTSLLRILCGLLAPESGEIRWKGTPTRDLAEDYRRELIYIGHANGVKEELTPAENLRYASCGLSPTGEAIAQALRAFGLERYHDAPVKTLSQGQRRRVALARLALPGEHPLWLLDEPFNALDANAAAQVQQSIDTHLDRGGIVVMTSHQPPAARARTLQLPVGLAA